MCECAQRSNQFIMFTAKWVVLEQHDFMNVLAAMLEQCSSNALPRHGVLSSHHPAKLCKSAGTTPEVCKRSGAAPEVFESTELIPAELVQHRWHPKWAATVRRMSLSGWLIARRCSGCRGPAQRHAELPGRLCAIAPLSASPPPLQPARS